MSGSKDSPQPSRLYGLAPCRASPPEGTRCRCGTRFGPGSPCYRFERVPVPVQDLFDGQRFCGIGCARALVLEALEILDSSSAKSVLRDLEEARVALRYLLAVMVIQGNPLTPRSPTEAPKDDARPRVS